MKRLSLIGQVKQFLNNLIIRFRVDDNNSTIEIVKKILESLY
jgi:hypothetical protein